MKKRTSMKRAIFPSLIRVLNRISEKSKEQVLVNAPINLRGITPRILKFRESFNSNNDLIKRHLTLKLCGITFLFTLLTAGLTAQTVTIPAGSFIINMEVTPQTVGYLSVTTALFFLLWALLKSAHGLTIVLRGALGITLLTVGVVSTSFSQGTGCITGRFGIDCIPPS